MWLWFVFGLIVAVVGIVLASSDTDIKIKNVSFDAETLGEGLVAIGGVLSGVMFVCAGVVWLFAQK